MGFGSVILIFAVGLLALIGAGLAVLFVAPPTDLIRDQLIAQVKSITGRDLAISGRTSLTFYPGLGFSLQGVSLSPPPGMQGAPFVRMKSLNVQVRLLPLLSRKVSVDQFVLDEPVFDFRVDSKGRKTWDFSAMTGTGPVQLAQAGGTSRNDAGGAVGGRSRDMAALDQLELGDVRIVSGKVRYMDASEAARESVEDINATVTLKAIGQPLGAQGDLRYRGDKVKFQTVLKSLKQILANQPADLEATANSEKFFAKYNGLIDASADLRLDGNVTVQSESVRQLARWLGTKLPPAPGFGPLRLSGQLQASGPVYKFARLELEVDGAKGTGDITADTSGTRPKLSGNLGLSVLDLNNYMPRSGAGNRQAKARKSAGEPDRKAKRKQAKRKTVAGQKAPGSIEELIGEPGPRVKGYTKRAGWSSEPIDMSALEALDADVKLKLGKLLYEDIKVGRSVLALSLVDKALTAKLDEMELYDGVGRGVLTLNAASSTPTIGANFNLSGVSALPLLTDAAQMEWLAGKGQLLLAVTSAGDSEMAIMSGLNGTTSFAFEDGAIVGVNVPKIVRSVQQGRFNDLKGAQNEQTDFSKLTGSFKITNGVAENNDLEMLSPLLRVSGAGQVMLPDRRVDYTVKPKLVSTLSGQGGKQGMKGLEIPVRVHGTFEKLNYTPDRNGVLSNPDALRENAGKMLDNLLGGGGDAGSKAKNLLDGFLGGR